MNVSHVVNIVSSATLDRTNVKPAEKTSHWLLKETVSKKLKSDVTQTSFLKKRLALTVLKTVTSALA